MLIFNPFRNNPRNRERFYFTLIRIVGFKNWRNIDKNIRTNWESSRLDFDRLFGMVKEFNAAPDIYEQVFTENSCEDNDEKVKNELEQVTTLCNEMKRAVAEIKKEHESLESIMHEQKDLLNNTVKILNCKEDFRRFRDELNKILSDER